MNWKLAGFLGILSAAAIPDQFLIAFAAEKKPGETAVIIANPLHTQPSTLAAADTKQSRGDLPSDADKAIAPEHEKTVASRHLHEVPRHLLSGPYREKAIAILDKPLFHRRGPVEVFPCPPKLYDWLLDHPHWVAEYWRQLGVKVGPVETTSDGFLCREGKHSFAKVSLLYQGPEIRVLYCAGESRQPPFPGKLRAEMVLVHRFRYSQQPDGQFLLMQQLEGFVKADSMTLKAVLKLTSLTSERAVDGCLQDLMVFFSVMTRVMQIRSDWTRSTFDRIRPGFAPNEGEELAVLLADLPPPPKTPIMPARFTTAAGRTAQGIASPLYANPTSEE